jgi:hypothetical protein
MGRRALLATALLLGTVGLAASATSCGARTALDAGGEEEAHYAGIDVLRPEDGGPDEGSDAFDVGPEAQPDTLPPVDARVPDDAPICPTGLTAYLISQDSQLYTFDPPTLATHRLGALDCPTSAVPWTLTASSSGAVYVLYMDWRIYDVDPATLECTATRYAPGQLSLGGSDAITVSPDEDGGERLYVYGQTDGGQTVLDVTDLTSFVLSEVGAVSPTPSEFPLDVRADPFGRIFGLGSAGSFDQIDRETAALVAEDMTSFSSGPSWALLTYNDAIYFFDGGQVSQYDLATKKVTPVGSVGITVVGASAAPCLH